MQQNINGLFAIECVRCVFSDLTPVLPRDDFDWFSFRVFCEKHCISNIVAYSVKSLSDYMPDEIELYFNEIIFQSMAKEALIEVEVNSICEAFEKNEIPYMLLKGSVMKNFYPQPDMRSMCDADILAGDRLDDAVKPMEALGYTFKERDNLHDCYFKKPFINIELHNALFDEELENLYSYFKSGFERANKKQGSDYQYELTDEDFYIFTLAHFAKHFKRTGTGIRSVADIFVYLSSHGNLNFDYINCELEKIGLLKFSKRIEAISFNWFEKGIVNPDDAVENYIISSGAFGSFINLELNRFLQSDEFKGSYNTKKLKYFLNVIFPGKDYMSARYPVLKKHISLLPLFWFIRIFYTLFRSFGSIKYRLKGVADSDKSYKDKFEDFN